MSVLRHSSSVRAGKGVLSQNAHAAARRRERNSGSPARFDRAAISFGFSAPIRTGSWIRGGASVWEGFTLRSPWVRFKRGGRSADRPLHLKLDETVHLDRVFHRELL